MKLTKIETEVLTKALKNQAAESREAPHWRPAIRCPYHAAAKETAGDAISPWCGEGFSKNTDMPGRFLQQVQDIFGAEIKPSRTNQIPHEAWENIGFVFVAGKVCWSRAEAERQSKEWQKKAPHLDCFVLPEIEPYADLTLAEIVGGTGGAELMYRNRPMVTDPAADTKDVEAAFKKLETRGFVVRIEGQAGACKWSGINITKKGAEAINTETIAPPVVPDPDPDGPRLKCISCGGVFHHMTDKFNPDEKPIGAMFRLLGKYQSYGWSAWAADWIGDALTCPECGERVVDPHTGLLPAGAIVENSQSH